VTIACGERVYDVFEESSWQRQQQRIEVVYRFVSRHDGQVHCQRLPQRYLLDTEWQQLLAASGFSICRHEGGFFGEPADGEAERHVVVAAVAAV